MAELTSLEGNFIVGKNTIIDAFIGGQNVVAIYLGKTLVWTKDMPLLGVVLCDEINRQFITEDETSNIFIDKNLDLNSQFTYLITKLIAFDGLETNYLSHFCFKLNRYSKCIDDTREAQISQPRKYPSKQPDEDSMYRDHISCHRELLFDIEYRTPKIIQKLKTLLLCYFTQETHMITPNTYF